MIEAALAALALVIGLQGAVLAYVVSIERRLTRPETLQEVRRAPRPPAVQ